MSISYYDIGYRAGEMAYEILAEGADITAMEIESAPEVTKMYNAQICEELALPFRMTMSHRDRIGWRSSQKWQNKNDGRKER